MQVFRIDVGTGRCEQVQPAGAGAEGALVWVNVALTDVVNEDRRDELASIGLPSCPLGFMNLRRGGTRQRSRDSRAFSKSSPAGTTQSSR
jgi:hypothetical protein